MAKGLISKAKLVAIANAIRGKNGETEKYTPDKMAQKIAEIPAGGDLPPLTNPAAAADIPAGKEAINGSGSKITGTMPKLTTSNITANIQESTGIVNAEVDCDSDPHYSDENLIKTLQLPIQSGATITPTTSEQTAVSTGKWTTGDVKVAGDANLLPENIKNGVSIFGVAGTCSGGASPLINGKQFASGTFTLAADVTSYYEIDAPLAFTPKTIICWTDAEVHDAVAGRVAGIAHVCTNNTTQHEGIVTTAAGGYTLLKWGFHVAVYDADAQKLRIYGDYTPMRAGWLYNWLAIQ